MLELKPCGSWWEITRWKRVFRWLRWMPIGYIVSALKFPLRYKLIKEEGWLVAWVVLLSDYERKLDRWWTIEKTENREHASLRK